MSLLFGCEPEEFTAAPPAGSPANPVTELVPLQETAAYEHLRTADLSEAHRAAALAYHNTLLTVVANADAFTESVLADAAKNPPIPTGGPERLDPLEELVSAGQLPPEELMGIQQLMEFAGSLNLNDYGRISELEAAFAHWEASNQVSQKAVPLVYYASQVLRTLLTDSQATLVGKPNQLGGDKDDDGQLCKVRHRNWISAKLGLCGPANDNYLTDDFWESLRTAVAETAASAIVGDSPTGSGGLAHSFLKNLLKNIFKRLLGRVWNDTFCKLDCDDCGPALGIAGIYSNCQLQGIFATGSAYEANEGITFRIDENLDFSSDFPVAANPGERRSLSTRIPRNSRFNVQADVRCDGNNYFPWPLDDWKTIDPTRSNTLPPTATVFGPPKDRGFYYPPFTDLCFSLRVSGNGLQYIGWSAPGGRPSSGTGRSFCVRWDDPNPVYRSILLSFRDPCTGEVTTVTGDSFLICSGCY